MASASGFEAVIERARDDRDGFWREAAEAIDWFSPPSTIFDPGMGVYGRWFPGAVCNTCHNAVDRHVAAGHGERAAIIYDSPVTGAKRRISYAELLAEVSAFGAILKDLGVARGDRVVIYMPMVPEALVAMLACARIGAIHSVVFGGFAAPELASRIDDCRPRLVLSASCGVEPSRVVAYKPLLDEALERAEHRPDACIILQRSQLAAALVDGRDHDWEDLRSAARARGATSVCEPVAATDPLYILYTSGTTGRPKGVVRDNGGHLVAMAWSIRNLYGVAPGEVFWAASDIGWVVGHSYIVYAPLIGGCTTILYEGKPVGTPDAGAFWRVAAEHGVAALFTAPTAFRAIRREDPEGAHIARHDLSRFRTLFLAGERADPPTLAWAERMLRIPVIDHWWQTETGWAICGNPVGLGLLPVKPGSPTLPMPGYDLHVLGEDGRDLPRGRMGALAIRLPLPPGCFPTLWESDERMRETYLEEFPGYYKTADAGYRDEDGYVFVMGRTDDIINVAGHRLSTGGMEEVLASHPHVAECAVIGVADDLKGEIPIGFVVLKSGTAAPHDAVEKECVALVRERIGPVAAFRLAVVVKRLPKTRSGKILRGTMRQIADGKPYPMPATIEDASVLGEIAAALASRQG
jgi:propionyl-CoA synthetase